MQCRPLWEVAHGLNICAHLSMQASSGSSIIRLYLDMRAHSVGGMIMVLFTFIFSRDF